MADAYLFNLVKQGSFEEARTLQSQTNPPPEETEWLEGIIAKRRGDIKEAEARFRKALQINPDHMPSRNELAHLYAATERYDKALFHLEALSQSAPSEAERLGYERFVSAIRSRRPWGLSASLGVLPSSNANKGSGKKEYQTDFGTFKINDESRGSSGIGYTASLSGYVRKDLNNGFVILATASGSRVHYENEALRQDSAEAGIEIGRQTESGNLFFGLLTGVTLKEAIISSRRNGIRLRGTANRVVGGRLGFSISAQDQDYLETNNRDGMLYNLSINWNRHLTASTSGGISLFARLEELEAEHLSHHDLGIGLNFRKRWTGGLVTGANIAYETHSYHANFPGTPQPREDEKFSAGVTMLHDRLSIAGFAPRFGYTYIRQSSNISFYDYDSHDFSLVLTQDF